VIVTGRGDGVWRDERRLSLAQLQAAMAVYSADGQVDDLTGGDAGAAAAFGAGPATGVPEAEGAEEGAEEGDPDPDSEQGRQLRPSPDGRLGPA
jgi:hypothetical protein